MVYNITNFGLLGGSAKYYNSIRLFSYMLNEDETKESIEKYNYFADERTRLIKNDLIYVLDTKINKTYIYKVDEVDEHKVVIVEIKIEGGSGGTSDYLDLQNKPQINGITLSGNKTLNDLGIQAKGDYATKNDVLTDMVVETNTTISLEAEKFYSFDEVAQLNITLIAPQENKAPLYAFEFISGTTPTTLNIEGISWVGGTPTIEASKTYQVSILNNIGVIAYV